MANKFEYHPLGFIEAKKWLDKIGKFDEVVKLTHKEGEETDGFKVVRQANKMWNEINSPRKVRIDSGVNHDGVFIVLETDDMSYSWTSEIVLVGGDIRPQLLEAEIGLWTSLVRRLKQVHGFDIKHTA